MFCRLSQTARLQSGCPLTFAALVLGHHPLKDHSYHLSDGGGRRVVGDVVLGEVQTETQHNGLAQTDQTLIIIMIILTIIIIIMMSQCCSTLDRTSSCTTVLVVSSTRTVCSSFSSSSPFSISCHSMLIMFPAAGCQEETPDSVSEGSSQETTEMTPSITPGHTGLKIKK